MKVILLVNENIKIKPRLGFKPNEVFYFNEKNWLKVFPKVLKKMHDAKTIVLDNDGFLPFLYFSKQKGICVSYPLEKEIATLSRKHNDATLMVLPLSFINVKQTRQYCLNFLMNEFEGDRHIERLAIMHKSFKSGKKATRFNGKSIIIASDHAGYKLKQKVIAHLHAKKYKIIDAGTHSLDSTAYSLYALVLGLNAKNAKLGIAICGSGVGIANTINKFKALNCSICFSPLSAQIARQKYGANVLAMGGRFISDGLANKIVDKFIATKPGQNFKAINGLGFEFDSKKFSKLKITDQASIPNFLKQLS